MILPIDKCPHCGGEVFYRKDYMSGPSGYFASNIIEVDNDSMYDSLNIIEGKWWYCDQCHKRSFEDKEVEY